MTLALTRSEKSALMAVDFDDELTKWAGFANNKGLRWRTVIDWNAPRTRGAMHASSFQSNCDMKLYLDRTGAKPRSKSPSDMVKRFDLGTAAHSMMVYYQSTRATYNDYYYDSEVSINKSDLAMELHLCGSADGVSTGWPIQRRVLWEYKTISLRAAARLKAPPPYYIKQVHVYMACLNIPVTVMTFIVKDSTTFISFVINFDPTLWGKLQDRAKSVNKAAKRGTPPIRRTDSNCSFCGHRRTCDPKIAPSSMAEAAPEFS